MQKGSVLEMPEYFIQERHLSSVTRTLVKDENGVSLFLLVGKWGGKGDVLALYKMNGDLVARIKQSSVIFGHKFDLYNGFEKVGSLKKFLIGLAIFIISNNYAGWFLVIFTTIATPFTILTRSLWKWTKQRWLREIIMCYRFRILPMHRFVFVFQRLWIIGFTTGKIRQTLTWT